MKLLIALLAGLLTFFSIIPSAHAADIARVTRQAKQLRKGKSHYTRDEKLHLVRLHRAIIRKIPHYGEGPMEMCVAAFVRHGLKSDGYSIINSNETILGGESKAKVFFVYNKQGEMKYVVKAFPKPNHFDTGLLAELSGMALIKERHLHTVSTVIPIDIGICLQNGSEYGLLLETAATGQRADQYIQAILDITNEDPKRKERLKEACRMCKAVGRGLSEFHGIDNQQRATLQRTGLLRAKLEYDILLTPEVKNVLQEYMDLETFNRYVRNQMHVALKLESKKYYRHGDAGPKNVFYDPKAKRILFIDVARIHHFINRAGHPQARNIEDLFLMHRKMMELAQNGLSEEERLQLSASLCAGYTAISGSESAHISSGHLYNVLAEISKCCLQPEQDSDRLQKNIAFLKMLIE